MMIDFYKILWKSYKIIFLDKLLICLSAIMRLKSLKIGMDSALNQWLLLPYLLRSSYHLFLSTGIFHLLYYYHKSLMRVLKLNPYSFLHVHAYHLIYLKMYQKQLNTCKYASVQVCKYASTFKGFQQPKLICPEWTLVCLFIIYHLSSAFTCTVYCVGRMGWILEIKVCKFCQKW